MSYIVLARKWRPKTFDDVIGQEVITQTLKNAVSTGKIAHALIFSGPRGVGKTSTARIIAKALNCEKGPTSDPCSNCAFCREISEGKSLDVIEIDAASHTGVDDAREIIENTRYLPSSGKTKIYIIDEAHMLSQSAFNALLKTLEEPPPHVLFILATTEVHKIPVTILSRCQRYDFKKVSTANIKERIELISSSEGIKIPEETLYLIAQESDGSLRDALSIVDQLIATFGNEIKHEDATGILGVSDKSLIKSTIEAILNKNPKKCIEILNEVSEKGVSPKRFAEDLLKLARYILLIKTCGKEIISEFSDDEKKELENLSRNESVETLEILFKMLLEGAEDVQRSFYPRMALEVTLVKLSLLERVVSLDDIFNKIDTLSKKIRSGNLSVQKGNESHEKPTANEEESGYDNDSPSAIGFDTKAKNSEENQSNSFTGSSLEEFIRFVKSKKPITATGLEHADKINVDNGILKIEFLSSSIHSDHLLRQDAQENLGKLSKEFFDQNLRVRVEVLSSSADKRDYQSLKEQNSKIKDEIYEDPIVKEALKIFGGRVVKIKPKDKE
ncbi:MAG: DNA polymerase III, subunit gamma and tau [Candidatus Dadabacteria bacterium RBG_19FT_COMBO_40_33]|nr:MAG: DNA polymerase III, subunit gamma and tau [Candidatus Dadabacteria bacterium RBG_19FT_COMBO_40_33]